MDNNFLFFYGGEFSQWYMCNFIIDEIQYNCAEQYMMAQKALLFKDYSNFLKIMKASQPHHQKALGKLVKNFNKEEWEKHCKKYVYDANIAKFSLSHLTPVILSTGDKELVEASSTDCIWGIGLAEGDPDCYDRSKWRGTNWLGEVLMEVRKDLRK